MALFNKHVIQWSGDRVVRCMSDYLFPIFCLRCEAEGEWVCADCLPLIGMSGVHACPFCHKSNADGLACSYCTSTVALTAVRAVTVYKEGALAALLIQTFK